MKNIVQMIRQFLVNIKNLEEIRRDKYLQDSANIADLENRMREWDRSASVRMFGTY